MHWIQKHVLKLLSVNDDCSYTTLKPEGVDGNLFMYHLNQLINLGYVQKTNKLYSLTGKGKKFVGKMSLVKGEPTAIPAITTMLYCKNKNGKYLLYRWNRQPYRNLIGLPFNRHRFGQFIDHTTKETLDYKTNLRGNLKYIGDVYLIISEKSEVAEHRLCHIFSIDNASGEICADGLTGEPFWGDISEHPDNKIVPGTKEIIDIIENNKSPFFEEIKVIKN